MKEKIKDMKVIEYFAELLGGGCRRKGNREGEEYRAGDGFRKRVRKKRCKKTIKNIKDRKAVEWKGIPGEVWKYGIFGKLEIRNWRGGYGRERVGQRAGRKERWCHLLREING